MENVQKCPKCEKVIFEFYCYTCNIDIRDFQKSFGFMEFFNDITKGSKDGF